jgi:type IV pilus modification protein PilV
MKGFSLIEVLVTLLIVSVGMLALGSFFVTSIRSEGQAQQRLAAVHLAEQIIEDWQKSNATPTPNCKVAGAVPTLTINGAAITDCVPNDGVPVPFDILIEEANAQAPIPNAHKLYPGAAGGAPMMGNLLQDPTNAGSAKVKVRKVKVSWTVNEQKKSVLLTHITRKPT